MSIYSGFALRSQETAYNKAVYNLLCLLQLKVFKTLNNGKGFYIIEPFDDNNLVKYFTKYYAKISELDESKHMAPLFSHSVKNLASYFNLCNCPNITNESFFKGSSISKFSTNRLCPSISNKM